MAIVVIAVSRSFVISFGILKEYLASCPISVTAFVSVFLLSSYIAISSLYCSWDLQRGVPGYCYPEEMYAVYYWMRDEYSMNEKALSCP